VVEPLPLLSPGTLFGIYRLDALIGAGGMGQVYRATDTRLRRQVAIKVLVPGLSVDPDFVERFEREGRLLASLNHPNIAAIHGREEIGGRQGLVLEFVDGSTLAERIAGRALPVASALTIARQIASALEAAHERGIVHRDLKPSNVKITSAGTVKILDFGIARANRLDADAALTTVQATRRGLVLGTPAYMSPEQARGGAVDRRTDIWAFGCVLYEMLTGRAAFAADTAPDTIARLLEREPRLDALPDALPVAIRRLVARCLAKDPSERLRDIADARLEIDDARSAPAGEVAPALAASARRRSPGWWLSGALAVALSMMVVLWAPWRPTPPLDRPAMRLNVDLGPDAVGAGTFDVAISPDATRLAFPVRAPDGKVLLATHRLSEPAQTLLSGTEGASEPFFAPDGQWIGFVADRQIRKVAVQGGAVVPICEVPNVLGATWAEDGQIVFGRGPFFPLQRVSENGGKPASITRTGELGDATHRWPQALPGGHVILFTSHKIVTGFDDAAIEAVTVATGARKTVLRGGYAGRFVATAGGAGYLVYLKNGTLFAAPFDVGSLSVTGAAVPVLEGVAGDSDSGAGAYDVSRNGTIVYKSGQGPRRTWPLEWLDSTGRTDPLIETPGTYYTPRVSPDGTRVALTLDRGDKGREIEVYDWHRGALTQLTFTGEVNLFPVWSPDGRYIVFESSSPNGYGIGLVRSDGSGGLQRLSENAGLMIPSSFSPDGKWLAYNTTNVAATGWVAPFDASDADHPRLGPPRAFDANGASAVFSPDGRWLAYHSGQSGRQEVYVRLASGKGGKVAVSASGGGSPVWDPTAHRLFFRAADGHLMVVGYAINDGVFSPGVPRIWCSTIIGRTPFGRDFSLSADGTRFVVLPWRHPDVAPGSVHVMFAINVLDRLRPRAAGPAR
jgi:Tol biopolymer transport system component